MAGPRKPSGKRPVPPQPEPKFFRMFWAWEVITDAPLSAQPGLLPGRALAPLGLLLWLLITIWLWPVLGWASLAVGLVFSRMMALDLTTYTLPNIYTLPLLLVGYVHAARHGFLGQALLASLALGLMGWLAGRAPQLKAGVGQGDLKLLAALFAWMPVPEAFVAVAAGCVLWLPFTLATPRKPVPLGVPILLGWLVMLRTPLDYFI